MFVKMLKHLSYCCGRLQLLIRFCCKDDDRIWRKARIIRSCKKIFKSFQTQVYWLWWWFFGGWVFFGLDSYKFFFLILVWKDPVSRILGQVTEIRWGYDSLLDYCKRQKGQKKFLGKIIPCRKAGDGCKATKKLGYQVRTNCWDAQNRTSMVRSAEVAVSSFVVYTLTYVLLCFQVYGRLW